MLNVGCRQVIIMWCQCKLEDLITDTVSVWFAEFWNLGTSLQRYTFVTFLVILIGYAARLFVSLENFIIKPLFCRTERRQQLSSLFASTGNYEAARAGAMGGMERPPRWTLLNITKAVQNWAPFPVGRLLWLGGLQSGNHCSDTRETEK